MNIRVITASAGTGKTTRLSQVLDDAIASGQVRPEGIVATTFTNEAAAQLIERARSRLLAGGRGREAHQLLAARIGTVNAVCGGLVAEFAFELGLSPALRVLDEQYAELEQKRALAGVVSAALADELHRFTQRFEIGLDWHLEVRKIIAAARSNGLVASDLPRCAERSIAALDAGLGPCEANDAAIDRALLDAIGLTLTAIDTRIDTTKKTAKYLELLRDSREGLRHGRLRWGDWSKLSSLTEVGAKSAAAAAAVARAAARHVGHPRLRAEMCRLISLLFAVAAAGLAAYQQHKRERGVIDFVDQEALALELLRRPDVREALAGQLDLVLVDEFQDTSPLQLAIFVELASLTRQSVWVGDQKQSIYGFRGTDPALMDAVIESLSGATNDPELVRAAVEAVDRASVIETLSVSYRSRPELVALTNDIFAPAFAMHGIPEDRTRLSAELTDESPDLGPIVEHWPLHCPKPANKNGLAAAVASGVRDLLAGGATVRHRGLSRTARRDDVAVLCRTNEQCQLVAEALAELDVRAVVPRMRLLDTVEGRLTLAGLRLWLDPGDALAAAELARFVTYAGDLDAFVARAIAVPGREAFADDPLVTALLAARGAAPDLPPASVIAAVIDAARLRTLCAAWGNSAQRQANLDALHAHAVAYVRESEASRAAPTLVGLLRHFEEMTDDWKWNAARSDQQALLDGDDAVTVSTWHRAKGREWPITVLFGLEQLREPLPYGLQVVSDAQGFDLARPLAGRWLRYWPNPYTTANQGGGIRDALEGSPAFGDIVARSQREALRLLYVGWTRARDRVVLAAARGKMTAGLFGALRDLDPSLISEPPGEAPGECRVVWAGRAVIVQVRPAVGAAAVVAANEPGEITVGRPLGVYAPARQLPSAAPAVPCTMGQPIVLGPRLAIRGAADMQRVGLAVHGFLAADRPELDLAVRVRAAELLLHRHGVDGHVSATDVAEAGARLWRWASAMFAPLRIHREWPVTARRAGGTVASGAADLVIRSAAGLAIIDHKTYPGAPEAALLRLPGFSGQLAAYAQAIAAATGDRIVSTWIHLPLLGVVVEMQITA